MRIGFIGLGRMGLPMARNLAKAGHAVVAYDLASAARGAAVAAGLEVAGGIADTARGADAVVTMLPAGKDVLAVYDTGGLIAATDTRTLLIDCSSIDVASAKRAHALASAKGIAALDAPVSGGIGGAEAGTLTFMVGGGAAPFEAARPVLSAMGRKIVHCGGEGAGQAVKICNQMMVAANVAVIAEAFLLAERLAVDPKVIYDVVTTSSGGSWALENIAPVPGIAKMSAADRKFAAGFTTALMLKDLGIFQDAARQEGSPSPVGAATTELYRMMYDHGYEALDYSAVIEFLRGKRPEPGAREMT